MVKLTGILKEVLAELADTQKPFSYHLTKDATKDDSEGVYLQGAVEYEFNTPNEYDYNVKLLFLPSYDDFYEYANDGEGQMVEVGFDANESYAVTDNINEFYKVMSTVVSCIKDSYEKYKFKYLAYQPTEFSKLSKDNKKAQQRDKVYQYYVKKQFPNSHIQKDGKFVFITLQ